MSDEEDTDSDGALSNATLIELVYKQGLNAAQWREIGTRLKVKSSTLDEIEWAHHIYSMRLGRPRLTRLTIARQRIVC